MNKKFTKLIAALALLAFMMPSLVGWGQTTYKLTQVSSVSAGNKYVFVNDGYAVTTASGKKLQSVNDYSTTGLIGNESYVYELESATEGFYLKNASLSSNQYLNNSKADMSMGSASSVWSITIATTNIATISNGDRIIGDTDANGGHSHEYKAYSQSGHDSDFTVYLLEEETTEPTITVPTTSLTNFTYSSGNGPSEPQSFTVSGVNLSANLSIAAPTDYELRQGTDGSWTNSISLTPSSGTVSSTTIYARLKSGLSIGNYNLENVTLTSEGATTKTVSLSGSVTGYTLTYAGNGNTGGNVPTDATAYEKGASVTILDNTGSLVKTHYDFAGWTRNIGSTPKTYAPGDTLIIKANTTVNAVWTPTTHTFNTAVDPSNSGFVEAKDSGNNVIASGDAVAETAQLTLTAIPAAGYKFISWSDGDGNSTLSSTTTNPTTFTMGTADVTITATFEAVTTHPVHWSVNGTVVKTDNVEENTAITFAAPTSGVPEGYVFRGWVTAANQIPTCTNTDPKDNYVTSANCTAEITYYAVMAVMTSITPTTVTLDASSLSTTNSYGTGTVDDDEGNTWSYNALINSQTSNQTTIKYFQLNKNANNYNIGSPSFSGNITDISMRVYNASSKYNRTVYICSSNTTAQPSSGDIASLSVPASSAFSTNRSINLSSSPTFSQFYVYVSDALGFSEIKVTYNKATYSNYCTTINTFTTAGNWNVDGSWSWGSAPTTEPAVAINAECTIPNNVVANVNNIILGDDGSLIIEDGGQLITNNAVNATVKKTIAAHGATTADGGWNFIASPIVGSDGIAPASVANMTDADFDLYRFNQEAELEWENYKTEGAHYHFNLYNGQGYLYANASEKTLEFAGAIKPSNTSVSIDIDSIPGAEFAGWNLVGNPFTFNAVVDKPYYKMNDDGSAILATEQTTGTIAPCTGIMVHVGLRNQSITFSKPTQSEPSNGNVSIAVLQANERGASATTVDKAIVSFNEGNELPKFYFGNPNANLYIPQGNKEYAILSTEAQGELPLNFRANENGQFTLTVNPEGIEMNYLHLIDNMTGANVDLLSTPSYTFTAKTTDYESRFRLVFSANNATTDTASEETFAFFSNGNLIVNNEGNATLQVIDVMGRVLSNQTISGTAELNLNQQPGVYVLRLVNGNDVKTQKIVVK